MEGGSLGCGFLRAPMRDKDRYVEETMRNIFVVVVRTNEARTQRTAMMKGKGERERNGVLPKGGKRKKRGGVTSVVLFNMVISIKLWEGCNCDVLYNAK